MTKQEDKELILKDLCARLPYGVKVFDDMGRTYMLNVGNAYFIDLLYSNGDYVEPPFKPYLRPMSSMTKEEKDMYTQRVEGLVYDGMCDDAFVVDWLNSHHFDFRGLIERGLAIEVIEENNPYKD